MRKGIKQALDRIVQFFRKHLSGENPDLAYYLLIIFAFIIFVFGLNFFVDLTQEVHGDVLEKYDTMVTDFVISFRTPVLNSFFHFVTDVGDLYGYLVMTTLAAIFLFLKLRHWKFIFQLLGVLVLAALSNIALKNAIDRARPTLEHMVVVESLSYPSGHAMSAMAFYGFLIYLNFQIKMSKWLRIGLTVVFSFLILSIGISRIYLGVHFPSDVAGGFIAGLIWVAFCIILFNIIDLLRERKKRVNGRLEEEEENLEE